MFSYASRETRRHFYIFQMEHPRAANFFHPFAASTLSTEYKAADSPFRWRVGEQKHDGEKERKRGGKMSKTKKRVKERPPIPPLNTIFHDAAAVAASTGDGGGGGAINGKVFARERNTQLVPIPWLHFAEKFERSGTVLITAVRIETFLVESALGISLAENLYDVRAAHARGGSAPRSEHSCSRG